MFEKGHKVTEEMKKRISETEKKYYREHPEEKQKDSEILKEYYRKHPEKQKGKNNPMYGKHFSEETKKKLSKALKKYFAEHPEARQRLREINKNVFPNIGKHEKQILDSLEELLGYRIIRQYEVGGYFLDGYIPEINLAIEVDEKKHKYKKEKDIKREEFIKQKLGCRFFRIKDY